MARAVACLVLTVLLMLGLSQKARAEGVLRDEVASILKDEGLEGAVWALVQADGSIETGAAGRRDARTGAAMQGGDRVHVGSVTKTLLAAGVLHLVTEGRLNLDTPVLKLLPGTPLDNPWERDHPVLVRHLLDHTAGLDDARIRHILSMRADPQSPLRMALDGEDTLILVRTRPGGRFSYSNLGYHLLAMVVEAVTGQRYEAYLDDALLKPLGMADSTFGFVPGEGVGADPRLAPGHFEAGWVAPPLPTHLRPAMQFATTAADMGRFARFLLGDGMVGGKRLIDGKLLRSMGAPVGTDAVAAGLMAGYALGLDTRDRHGVRSHCHSGNMIGYRAMLCLLPETSQAFFVSVNTDSEGADHQRVDERFVRALGAPTLPDPAVEPLPQSASYWRGIYVPSPSRFEVQAYTDVLFGFASLKPEGDRVTLTPFLGTPRVLVPVGGNLFRAEGRRLATHVLLTTAEGDRVVSTGFQSLQEVGPWRVGLLWGSLVAGVVGALYVLVVGLRLMMRRQGRSWRQPLMIPLACILLLLLSIPLLVAQPFMALGDLTVGSGLLAASTAALPLGCVAGLVLHLRHGRRGVPGGLDAAALVAVVQWTAILATFELVPLKLWA